MLTPDFHLTIATPVRQARPTRVVLDAAVVISALMFGGGPTADLRRAWQGGYFRPLVSEDTMRDLHAHLATPQLGFSRWDQRQLLNDFLPHTVHVPVPAVGAEGVVAPPRALAYGRLAMVGRAHAWVSADPEILSMQSDRLCPTFSIDTFVRVLCQSEGPHPSSPDGARVLVFG